MSTDNLTDYEPIRVQVMPGPDGDTSFTSAAGIGGNRWAGPPYRTVYRTIHLTSAEPAQELFPISDDRVNAYVLPIDDTVTIAKTRNDAANGYGATIPSGTPLPVPDNSAAYVGAQTFSGGSSTYSRVTVIAVYKA